MNELKNIIDKYGQILFEGAADAVKYLKNNEKH